MALPRAHALPPPPYVCAPGHRPSDIGSYTVVGGSNVWISTEGVGTYSFNTARSAWVLPFDGLAEYVPEH